MPKKKKKQSQEKVIFAPNRLQRDMEDVRSAGLGRVFRNVVVSPNHLLWTALLLPDTPPYSNGAFRVEIQFPMEYPLKPPKVYFKTKMYHPNIDEKGQVSLPIIDPEHWKPTTTAEQVIQTLIATVNDPQPANALRPAIAEEFVRNYSRFFKNAEEFVSANSEVRPAVALAPAAPTAGK